MRRLLLPLLLLVNGSLSALEFFPPAPDSHSDVRIRFLAAACSPVTHAAVTGSTITLTSTPSGVFGCIATYVPQPAIVDVGVLAPGVYDVHGETGDRCTLVVRDAGAGFVVSPVGLSA